MNILCFWALSGTRHNEERACKVQTLNKMRTHITCRESARNKSYPKPNRELSGYAKRESSFLQCSRVAFDSLTAKCEEKSSKRSQRARPKFW